MQLYNKVCPICTWHMKDTPEWAVKGAMLNGERTLFGEFAPKKGWFRWECGRCGTVAWVKPFKYSKTAERVSF